MWILLSAILTLTTAEASKPTWTCSMSVTLTGRSDHFVVYGRDSWHGRAPLRCQLGLASAEKVMDVTFNALDDGFGADLRSVLTATLALTTQVHPEHLLVRRLVTDTDSESAVRWSFATGLTSGTLAISRVQEVEARRSLQKGTLFIRGTTR